MVDNLAVGVEDNEVVCIPDHDWRGETLASRRGLDDGCFQSMQCDVGQQRRDRSSLHNAGKGGEEIFSIQDSGLKPCFDLALNGGAGIDLG